MLENIQNFWFRNPGAANNLEIVLLVLLFGLVIFSGLAGFFLNSRVGRYPPKNKIIKPTSLGLIYIGGLGLLFTLFRKLGIDFLGVRFFEVVIFLFALAFLGYFVYLYKKKLPSEILKYESQSIKRRYLKN